jgi:hypothetical protein
MGMLAARNVLGDRHDIWTLNPEDEYLEEVREADKQSPSARDIRQLASTQPLLPSVIPARAARVAAMR